MINLLSITNKKIISTKLLVALSLILVVFSVPLATRAAGASLYLAPSQGSFLVGSTFSISIYVNTKGNEINVVELDLKFPPDILQVTSPTAGESFVSEWLTPPSYSNTGGTVSFKGGIPEGIVATAGLVSTITFRAKASGQAKVEFLDSSRVLLADGKGTPVFTTNISGVYEILIPPPEGPKITSTTHPDPEIWYSDPDPSFSWGKKEGVTDFSYSFSQNPKETPDIISEGDFAFKSYEGISDGVWYFHLRQKENGVWGKTSHASVRIDTTPPKRFEPRAEVYSGFVYFETQDVHSGIDHYEISAINLTQTPTPAPFFVEASSPYKIPYEETGRYQVIIRAMDRAGNLEEVEIKFQKLSPSIFLIGGKGIQIKGVFLSWPVFFLGLFLFLVSSGYLIFYLTRSRAGFKKGIKEIGEALVEIEKIEEREREVEKIKKKFEEEKEKLEEKLGKR